VAVAVAVAVAVLVLVAKLGQTILVVDLRRDRLIANEVQYYIFSAVSYFLHEPGPVQPIRPRLAKARHNRLCSLLGRR
jgi:hypothetical protein